MRSAPMTLIGVAATNCHRRVGAEFDGDKRCYLPTICHVLDDAHDMAAELLLSVHVGREVRARPSIQHVPQRQKQFQELST